MIKQMALARQEVRRTRAADAVFAAGRQQPGTRRAVGARTARSPRAGGQANRGQPCRRSFGMAKGKAIALWCLCVLHLALHVCCICLSVHGRIGHLLQLHFGQFPYSKVASQHTIRRATLRAATFILERELKVQECVGSCKMCCQCDSKEGLRVNATLSHGHAGSQSLETFRTEQSARSGGHFHEQCMYSAVCDISLARKWCQYTHMPLCL